MKKILSILAVLFFINCTNHWGNFKKYSLKAPENLEVLGGEVSGKSCGFSWFFQGWYSQNLAEATRDALSKVPGATGLKDASVEGDHSQVLIVCMKITGIPVKEKE
ncbi:MAG: hypothetical protein KDK54_05035 [Leptospiraceae bacterium]|nr:hypothetical protein [Leptospiraceae bacterium]